MAEHASLYKFAVWITDYTDPDALNRRMSVRPVHQARAQKLVDDGIMKVGGALLSPESFSSPTAEKKMVGSLIVFEAESIEAVRKLIEEDLFYTSNVWDKEKIMILPFACATPL